MYEKQLGQCDVVKRNLNTSQAVFVESSSPTRNGEQHRHALSQPTPDCPSPDSVDALYTFTNAVQRVLITFPDQPSLHPAFLPPKTQPPTQYSTSTIPMIMPASFRIATLFPCCAMRVKRPALPCRLFERLEKALFWGVVLVVVYKATRRNGKEERPYRAIDDGLVASIVVDVYRYAP